MAFIFNWLLVPSPEQNLSYLVQDVFDFFGDDGSEVDWRMRRIPIFVGMTDDIGGTTGSMIPRGNPKTGGGAFLHERIDLVGG